MLKRSIWMYKPCYSLFYLKEGYQRVIHHDKCLSIQLIKVVIAQSLSLLLGSKRFIDVLRITPAILNNSLSFLLSHAC